MALTLKVVGGFSASEAARAFLVTKETMAQRIVRAKRTLREGQVSLAIPGPDEIDDRLAPVLQALYLMFNEGFASWAGETHLRRDLCHEAIRLCGLLAGHRVTGRPESARASRAAATCNRHVSIHVSMTPATSFC